MAIRKIIHIDEDKCDGCGNCIPSCAEGALAIVDGKARIVKDLYCDGLGACLGACPRDALHVIEREAVEFDEHAAMEHVARMQETEKARPATLGCGCPGSAMKELTPRRAPANPCPCMTAGKEEDQEAAVSELTHWPVQIRLIPPQAPFMKGADILVAADCVPVALPDFHAKLLAGRKVLIGCPKFDDAEMYVERLAELFREAAPKSVTIARMEVPCCRSLTAIVNAAAARANLAAPVREAVVTRDGTLAQEEKIAL